MDFAKFLNKSKPKLDLVNKEEFICDEVVVKLVEFDEYKFKIHDRIRITRRVPRDYPGQIRLCDIYLGYIGTIRKYYRGGEYAQVTLDVKYGNKLINIPVKFLEILIE